MVQCYHAMIDQHLMPRHLQTISAPDGTSVDATWSLRLPDAATFAKLEPATTLATASAASLQAASAAPRSVLAVLLLMPSELLVVCAEDTTGAAVLGGAVLWSPAPNSSASVGGMR